MTITFNKEPWYDDFDPTKNYHRILFKPGYAVQARELTQSQTILQDQISKFGSGIYADGSKVSGGNIFVDSNITTCKLLSNENIAALKGLFAVGQTSKLIAEVVNVDITNYYLITKPVNVQNNTLFSSGETIHFFNSKNQAIASLNGTVSFTYSATSVTEQTINRVSSGTYMDTVLNINTANINVGDTIAIESIGLNATVTSVNSINQVTLNTTLSKDLTNAATVITNKCSVKALEVGIDEGVWFTNGLFVYNASSFIVPEPLNAYPSVVVGFEVSETYVDSFTDSSLLDPAIGASNYQAPGADRYKVSLTLTSKPYLSDQVVANLTTVKFIELVRINKGLTEDINNKPIFTEVSKAIAQSVFDQAGNFVVNPFSLVIIEGEAASANATASISAGKVYLNGSAVEHIAPTKYYIQKARDTESQSNISIESYYGNYVKLANVASGIVNFQSGATVNLINETSDVIGTAKVRNFAYNSGSLKNAKYNAYLFDVNITSTSNTFSNVSVISSSGFSAQVQEAVVVDNNYNSLVFPFPQKNISSISKIDYVTTRLFSGVTFNNGVTTINTTTANEDFMGGSGQISGAVARQYYFVIAKSTSGDYTAGQLIPLDDTANVTVTITNSNVTTGQAQFNVGGAYNGTADIFSTISVTSDSIKNKNLVQNYAQLISANPMASPIDIGVSDVYRFKGVFEVGLYTYSGAWNSAANYSYDEKIAYGDAVYSSLSFSNQNYQPDLYPEYWKKLPNMLSNYVTDNGQRDAYYDHGTVTNISGVPRGRAVVIVDYFTHSGGKGPITVNSYAGVSYSNIPTFTSKLTGVTYNLRDVLDFRPRKSDGVGVTTFDSFQLPAPLDTPFADYSYYLSRIDKIVIKANGQFKTKTGKPSYSNPVEPVDDPDALTLFTLNLPAYTYSKDDITITPTNLRRYTMRDIGVLDKRITNIEYYTALSLLEKEVRGSDVTDSTGTQLLFKNGFLVDSFKSHSVGDVGNPDYSVSVDPTLQLARPAFTSATEKLNNSLTQGSYITSPGTKTNNYLSVKNNIITFSYGEQIIVNQNVATEIVNVNPFNVSYWSGTARLSPSSDTWYDTSNQPIINVVNEDQTAWISAVNGAGFGSQWNDWQFNWSGQNIVTASDLTQITRDTIAIKNVLTSKGLNSSLVSGNITVSTSTQIINTAIIPYARSVPIRFDVYGMPPYTVLYTYINRAPMNFAVSADSSSVDGLYAIDVINGGSGYPNGIGQPIVQIAGTSSASAVATADVVNGSVTAVTVINPGYNYIGSPAIYVASANTSPAVLRANTQVTGVNGGMLRTDQNGHASGTITLPCNDLAKFPTGQIIIEFSDSILSPIYGNAYAKSVFYSQGTLETLQTTVVSTRPPISTPRPATQVTVNPEIAANGSLQLAVNPIPFIIAPQDNASVNTVYISATTPVYGLPSNTSITLTASNGLLDAGTTQLSSVFAASKTVTTSNTGGLVLAAKGLSATQYDTPTDVIISLGNIPVHYVITTKIADKVPDSFGFAPVSNVALSSTQTSNTVTVTGLSPSISVLVSSDGGSFDAGTSSLSGTFGTTPKSITTSGTGTLVVAARGTASSSYGTPVSVRVTVGSVTGTYVITTDINRTIIVPPAPAPVPPPPPVSYPYIPSFGSSSNADLNADYTSNQVTATNFGSSTTVSISASGGSFRVGTSSISGSEPWLTSGTVTTTSGGTFVIQAKNHSSSSSGQSTQTTVTGNSPNGSASSTYSVQTKSSQPQNIQFDIPAGPTNVALNGNGYASGVITVTGAIPNTPISVSASGGGTILANSDFNYWPPGGGGAAPGGFSTSQTVTADSSGRLFFQVKSAGVGSYSQTYTTTVTIGGVSRNWVVSSMAEPLANLGVWSNDEVTKRAQALSFAQGNAMVRDMMNRAGGAYATLSSICGNSTFTGVGYNLAKRVRNPPTLTQYAGIMVGMETVYGLFLLGKISQQAAIDTVANYYASAANRAFVEGKVGSGAYLGALQDPLSQNFFITEGQFPNGAFISSVDLFFARKDPLVPVTVRIRPVVNGYPDSVNDIPGSIVTKNPDQINTPNLNNIYDSIGLPTKFEFDHPIYLPAGQYSLMVATNSDQYAVYASKMGEVQLGTRKTITSVSYAGAFFKSQNSQTWIPAAGETLCFRAYVCDFAGGTASVQFTSNTSSSMRTFDLIQLNNHDITFNALDSIDYDIKTTDYATGLKSDFIPITSKQNFVLPSRKVQSASGDIVVRATMTNTDRWTSPLIDLERLYPVMVNNVVNAHTSDKVYAESLPGFRNGGAISKYITKRVTLANNFDSTGLTVYLDVNRQPGTSIEVYYKVLNNNDGNNFDDQPYQLMNPIFTPGGGLPKTGPNDWVTDTYQALNITYHDVKDSTVTYNNFKVFSIKVCFYSDNPTVVPQIKNLRAVATA